MISRYRFYLAQSYRDSGEREKALENYLKRAELGYWPEEVFESLYCAAKLREALEFPDEEVIATYLRATDAAPTRAEALHGLSQFCRSKGRNEEGFQYAKRGLAIPLPEGGLFVESWIYDFGLLDELGINGVLVGATSSRIARRLSAAFWAARRFRRANASVWRKMRGSLWEKTAKGRWSWDPPANRTWSVGRHVLTAERPLRSQVIGTPRILLAILAKQKEEMLPLYLDCIEALDYPKSQIVLYVRTNNNTDGTERPPALEWVAHDVGRPLCRGPESFPDAADV